MRPLENNKSTTPKPHTFLNLWKILWPKDMVGVRQRFVSALVFMILAKLFLVMSPVGFKYAIEALEKSQYDFAIWMLVIYAGFRIAASFFTELRDFTFAKVTQRSLRDAAGRVFSHLHSLSLSFHLNRQTGGLTRVIERGTKGIETLLNFLSMIIIPTAIEIILATIIMIYLFGYKYALITIAIMASYIAYTLQLTKWRLIFVKSMNTADNAAQTRAVDSLLNFETVKYFGNQAHEEKKFGKLLKDYESMAVQSRRSMNFLNFGQALIIATGLGLLLNFALMDVKAGVLTIGDVVAMNTYLLQLYIPLNNLGFAYREVKNSAVSFEEMYDLLAVKTDVLNTSNPKKITTDHLDIDLKNVSFSYDGQREIISNLSCHIEYGKTLAIVGTTGSGKSTISKLLFRFYDPTAGQILINGIDIRDLDLHDLQSFMAVVPQDTVLFNDTIFYNIQYGNPHAPEADVRAAAEQAHIHDFIMSLPDQYETKVGERGLKLSGGEKQRVAIARALLKKPKIFIFDEATSSLDTKTERSIQDNLEEISKSYTSIIIAHRLSTIVNADHIIVLENGKIVEQGDHQKLLQDVNGRYFEMWQRQQVDPEA
jgi:ABC-type transport system involved in Fe-S cluster assembly fused permease/ATPase subunit